MRRSSRRTTRRRPTSQREQITMYRERRDLDTQIGELSTGRRGDGRREESKTSGGCSLAGQSTASRSTATGSCTATSRRTPATTSSPAATSQECSKIAQSGWRAGRSWPCARAARVAQADAGEHALVERRRAHAAAAHRADLPGHRQVRPLVASATKATLERGQLTYPKVVTRPSWRCRRRRRPRPATRAWSSTCRPRPRHVSRRRRPVVAGDQLVDAGRAPAVVRPRRGGLRAEDGAGRGDGVSRQRRRSRIGSPLGASPTFAEFMTASARAPAPCSRTRAGSADTLYMAPDRYWYLFGLTSTRSRSS
jgi:hypothetical protein